MNRDQVQTGHDLGDRVLYLQARVRFHEHEALIGSDQELNEVCRHLEIAESTWHRWLAQYGGMKANEAKRLKELEAENARLKKLVANQALDIDMLKEISAGNF